LKRFALGLPLPRSLEELELSAAACAADHMEPNARAALLGQIRKEKAHGFPVHNLARERGAHGGRYLLSGR
jgi:hypothetical protein